MDYRIIAADNYATASECIIDMLKKTDQSDLSASHIVISNDRCSMSTELEVLDALGGSFNTRVLTFARLTSAIMTEKKFISKQSAIMLISKLAGEMKDDFCCFKKSYDTTGFAQSMYEAVSQLKYSAVEPRDINPDAYEKNLRAKMRDVRMIYAAYEDFIKDRYVDSGSKLKELIARCGDSGLIKNSRFYIKDFDNFSTQEILIIRQLVIHSKGVVVAVPYMPGDDLYPDDAFRSLVNVASGLETDAKIDYVRKNRGGFTSVIADNLFRYKTSFVPSDHKGAVSVRKAGDVFAEMEGVAAYIRGKVERGARYKDFLIVAGDVEKYVYAADRVFGRYGVPYFPDTKVALSEHPFCAFLTDIVRAAVNGLDRESCLRLAKNYFFPSAGETPSGGKTEWFENYCLKNNLLYFSSPFDDMTEEGAEAEKIRREIADFVSSVGITPTGTVGEYAEKLLAVARSGRVAALFARLAAEEEAEYPALRKVTEQIPDKTADVLETLAALFGEDRCTAEKFSDTLKAGFDSTFVSIIPLYNDCVVFTSVAKARANGNRHLIVVGAADGEFPSVRRDTKIISDADIDKLEKGGVSVTPKTENRNRREKFNVYQLLSAPRESLYMSYVVGGDGAAPCEAAEEIAAMFGMEAAEVSAREVYGLKQAEEIFVGEASAYMDGYNPSPVYAASLYRALKDGNPALFGYLAAGGDKPPIKNGEAVLLPKGRTSVTRMEQFYRCPYGYFLAYGIGAKERETGELRPPDTGSILHDVLEQFIRINYIDGGSASAEDIVARCLGDDKYAYLKKIPGQRFAFRRLEKEAVAVCAAAAELIGKSAFRPAFAELPFGYDGKETVGEISLVGKIDRIDTCGGKFILLDYKTGKARFSESLLYAGQKLQLLTYVAAAEKLTGKECAGFFYMPVHDKFTDGGPRYGYTGRVLDDGETVFEIDITAEPGGRSEIVGCGIKKDGGISGNGKAGMTKEQLDVYKRYTAVMLQNAVDDMKNGFIAQRPYDNACEHCVFSAVCDYIDLGGSGNKVSADMDTLTEAVKNG